MSFWDNVKKFAQPYADDEYDEYDEEEEVVETYEEVAPERPARQRRASAFSVSSSDDSSYSTTASTGSTASSFSGQVVSIHNKQEVVLFHPANFNGSPAAAPACGRRAEAERQAHGLYTGTANRLRLPQ